MTSVCVIFARLKTPITFYKIVARKEVWSEFIEDLMDINLK
jgi:hypothetical protein